jgi:hypothetical protein
MEASGQLNDPAALPPGKEPLYSSLDRRPDGPQSRSGRGGEENKNPFTAHCQEKKPNRPARSLVTIVTELSRLFDVL